MSSPFSGIICVAKTANSLSDFITDGTLSAILGKIGRTELRAATSILNNLKITTNVREQILLATGHLQSAVEAFNEDLKASEFKMGVRPMYYEGLAIDQYWVCSLLAMCYVYLGETKLAWRLEPYGNRARDVYNFLNKDRNDSYDDSSYQIGLVFGLFKFYDNIKAGSNLVEPDFYEFKYTLYDITGCRRPKDLY